MAEGYAFQSTKDVFPMNGAFIFRDYQISEFESKWFANICPQYYSALNASNGTVAVNASTLNRSCPAELGVLTESTDWPLLLKVPQYSRADAPGTMLRASAEQLAKVLLNKPHTHKLQPQGLVI